MNMCLMSSWECNGDLSQLGLRQELCDFVANYPPRAGLANVDRAMGIHQSIGLKEFAAFLQLPPEERDSPAGERLFQEGCELLKLHTRQYARKQRTWVRSRLLKRVKRQVSALDILFKLEYFVILCIICLFFRPLPFAFSSAHRT